MLTNKSLPFNGQSAIFSLLFKNKAYDQYEKTLMFLRQHNFDFRSTVDYE